MHHPAAFSTALFHSGSVSRILRFTLQKYRRNVAELGSCCQTPLGHPWRRHVPALRYLRFFVVPDVNAIIIRSTCSLTRYCSFLSKLKRKLIATFLRLPFWAGSRSSISVRDIFGVAVKDITNKCSLKCRQYLLILIIFYKLCICSETETKRERERILEDASWNLLHVFLLITSLRIKRNNREFHSRA